MHLPCVLSCFVHPIWVIVSFSAPAAGRGSRFLLRYFPSYSNRGSRFRSCCAPYCRNGLLRRRRRARGLGNPPCLLMNRDFPFGANDSHSERVKPLQMSARSPARNESPSGLHQRPAQPRCRLEQLGHAYESLALAQRAVAVDTLTLRGRVGFEEQTFVPGHLRASRQLPFDCFRAQVRGRTYAATLFMSSPGRELAAAAQKRSHGPTIAGPRGAHHHPRSWDCRCGERQELPA